MARPAKLTYSFVAQGKLMIWGQNISPPLIVALKMFGRAFAGLPFCFFVLLFFLRETFLKFMVSHAIVPKT